MKRILAVFAIFAWVQTSNANASEVERKECVESFYKEAMEGGSLFVTEAEIMYIAPISNCYVEVIISKDAINLKNNRILYFWFRLQGDEKYLERRASSLPLTASFNIKVDGNLVWMKSLPLGNLDKEAVQREAKSSGIFDWRTNADKWALDVPGIYIVYVEQGTERVCISDPIGRNCGLHFTVK